MNRNLRAWCGALAAAALMLACAGPARAQNATAGGAGEWLSRYDTARSLGLGGAFVAVADDPMGALWNPAGLSFMDQNELRVENALLFDQTTINGFSLAIPGSRLPGVGLSALSLSSGDFERTNDLNDPLGTFRQGQTAYLLTLSKSVSSHLALGTNLKYAQQTIESFSGGGFGFDLGAMLTLTPDLRVGASVTNLGGPKIQLRDVSEPFDTRFRGGAALAVLGGRGLISAQIDHSQGLGTQLHGGAEYRLMSNAILRAGYDNERATGGISYRFQPQYELDYAVSDHTLGLTHRLGISYRFGGFYASSDAQPRMFSPTGEHAVTRISLNSRTKGTPESWALEILDKSDRVVRRFGGQDQPSSHIEWDGKDETGLPLADGLYRYRLQVKDRQGRIVESPFRTIEISTGGPQGSVPVISVPVIPAP